LTRGPWAEGRPADKARDFEVLRRLTADGDLKVRLQATLGLAIRGDEPARKAVRGWFAVEDRGKIFDCLRRARNLERLKFAREALEKHKYYEHLLRDWDGP
jgi:hypothetical protein